MTRNVEDDRRKVNRLWLPVILAANLIGGAYVVANLEQAPTSAAFMGLFLVLVDALAIYRWRAWAAQRRGTSRANQIDPSLLQQLVASSFMLCASLVIVFTGVARHEAGRVVGGLIPGVICVLLIVRAAALIRRRAPGAPSEDKRGDP
jgi:heme A synthase